jgi:sugar phosphate isomerase/epimerase
MTRREAILAALAAAAARGDSGSRTSRLSAIDDEIGLSWPETIAFAKQYGVQWLELRGAQIAGKHAYVETMSAGELKALADRLSGEGLGVSVLDSSLMKFALPGTTPVTREDFYVQYFAEMGLDDATLYRTRLDLLSRTLDAARALNTRRIRIFAFWRTAEPAKEFGRIAEIIAGMAELAGNSGCQLIIENEYSTNAGTCAETAALLKLVPSPWLGVNYDPQNSAEQEPDVFADGYDKLPRDRIWNVHVKAEGLFGPKHPLDWGAIMHRMLRDGYAGKFSLETHRGHDERNVAASRECIEKMIRLVNAA